MATKNTTEHSRKRELIEQKIAEIDRKLSQQEVQDKLAAARSGFGQKKRLVDNPPPLSTSPSVPARGPSENVPQGLQQSLLANDGSFMDKFKKLCEPHSGESQSQSGNTAASQSGNTAASNKTTANKNSTDLSQVFDIPMPKVFPPEDQELVGVIKKLAEFVAEGGAEVEQAAKARSKGNPALWFLHQPTSRAYKYFKQCITETIAAKKEEKEEIKKEPEGEKDLEIDIGKRKRSRWGPEAEKSTIAPPTILQATQPLAANSRSKVGIGSLRSNVNVVGSSELSSPQKQQIQEQRQMTKSYQQSMAKKKDLEVVAVAGKPKYKRDSDEETKGGTWECNRRKAEMSSTQDYCSWLTDVNKGRHHIGGFMLLVKRQKFTEKFQIILRG